MPLSTECSRTLQADPASMLISLQSRLNISIPSDFSRCHNSTIARDISLSNFCREIPSSLATSSRFLRSTYLMTSTILNLTGSLSIARMMWSSISQYVSCPAGCIFLCASLPASQTLICVCNCHLRAPIPAIASANALMRRIAGFTTARTTDVNVALVAV